MESIVKQKLAEAEEADPGYVTILGKKIHRSSNWFNGIVFVLVLVLCSAVAMALPKLMNAG